MERPDDKALRERDAAILAHDRALEEAKKNQGAAAPPEDGGEPNMGDSEPN